jgi:hypothetical protein
MTLACELELGPGVRPARRSRSSAGLARSSAGPLLLDPRVVRAAPYILLQWPHAQSAGLDVASGALARSTPGKPNRARRPHGWMVAVGWTFLNVTCVQCENGKYISRIDSAQPTMAHDDDTDSDLARPPYGNHPSAWHATQGMLLRSATRQHAAGHVVAHPGSCDSE